MRTFAEIAKRARTSYTGDMLTGTLELVEELAEALERLEYNTAVQLAAKGMHAYPGDEVMRHTIGNYVRMLRENIPEDALIPPPELHYAPGQDER